MLVLHVPPTCSPTALRSPGARLCVRAASVRPSERLVVGRVVRCQLVLTRCSFMYGEGLMAGAVRAAHSTRLCPVLTVTAVSPSIVPAALLKSTMSFAPTPRTHVSNLKWHLKEYSKWKRFRIVPVIGRYQNINGKSEIQVHSTPLGRGAFERAHTPRLTRFAITYGKRA